MIIGIDPGATGAVAIMSDNGYLIDLFDLPHIKGAGLSPQMLATALGEWDDVNHAFIERVAARPGAGVSGMFNFGRDFGVILGVCGAMAIPYSLATPSKWKRDLGLTADKDQARARAAQLWPGAAKQFARKKDDGRAEAALIALWGSKHGKALP
jgi:crossover junction endodeoxyribonuclease RuvC